MLSRVLYLLPAVLAAGELLAADSPASFRGNACAASIFQLSLNGVPAPVAPDGVIGLQCGQEVLLLRGDLRALRLLSPKADSFVSPSGEGFIALSDLAGVRFALDASTQSVRLTAAPDAFFSSSVSLAGAERSGLSNSRLGGFLNYDAGVERTAVTRFNFLGEAGAFGPWGILTTTFVRSPVLARQMARLDTLFIYDRPKKAQSLRLGDSISRGGSWARSVYFGGVQWGTDFDTQPELVTFPLPSMRGDAVVPSTAELYVNNALRSSSAVPAGPFEIVNPPLIAGAGQLTLVVRDVFGHETVTTRNYFSTARLLRKGLTDYNVTAGKVREGYGVRSFGYGRALASGLYRRGLTNFLTAEIRSEAIGRVRDAGMTLTVQPLGRILASGGYVMSTSEKGAGRLVASSVELQTRRFSAGVQGQSADMKFRQLGLDREHLPPRLIRSGFLSVSVFGRDHLTASVFEQKGEFLLRYGTASYSFNVGRHSFVQASYNASLSGTRERLLSIGLTYQIGERTFVKASGGTRSGEPGGELLAQRNLPIGNGIGYRAEVDEGYVQRTQGELNVRVSSGEASLQISQNDSGMAYRAGFQGGVGYLAGKTFLTRRIADGFAVVKVGDFPGVQVYSEHQPIAVTGRDGIAVVPRLLSFQTNHLSIDPDSLPLTVTMSDTEVGVQPRRRAGIEVQFPVTSNRGVLVRIRLGTGEALPVRAEVRFDGRSEALTAAMDGEVYVDGLTAGSKPFSARWNRGSCRGTVEIPKQDGYAEVSAVCSAPQ